MRFFERCVIPAQAGIQGPGTRGQVWMPAFAGMTLTFPSHPSLSTNSRDKAVYFGRVAIVTPHMSPAMAAAGVSKTHEREVEGTTS
jgi:hypothetical protein